MPAKNPKTGVYELLKDLPDYKAGQRFTLYQDSMKSLRVMDNGNKIEFCKYIYDFILIPEWFKYLGKSEPAAFNKAPVKDKDINHG